MPRALWTVGLVAVAAFSLTGQEPKKDEPKKEEPKKDEKKK